LIDNFYAKVIKKHENTNKNRAIQQKKYKKWQKNDIFSVKMFAV